MSRHPSSLFAAVRSHHASSPDANPVLRSSERVRIPAEGIGGGGSGATGAVEINGMPVGPKVQHVLQPGDVVTLRTPGGGGHGPPAARDPAAGARDRTLGYT